MKKGTESKSKTKPAAGKWSFVIIVIIVICAVLYYFVLRPGTGGKQIDGKGYNLLVITLDTMRADRIGAYGYKDAQTPNIDRLAENGVLFENCYAPVPLTLPAHVSIFTGKYPLGHGVRDNGAFFLAPSETTLAESMKKKNYQTFAAIASFVLLSKFGLNQGFDVYDDALEAKRVITHLESEIKAGEVYAKFDRWFKGFQKQPAPASGNETRNFLAWVHFYDPHTPYDPPKEYRDKFPDTLQGKYDGEVAYTDFYAGKIIDDLKNANLLDNTLVVIVGDHGEAFGEHNEYGHSFFCYQENLRVPLIFYNPRLLQTPNRVANRVNLVDLMPTFNDIFGLQNDTGVQGGSLVPLLAGETQEGERTFYIESMHGKEEMGWAPLMGIITGNYKYISLPEPELYDLDADKNEKENLFWKKNRFAKSLDTKLRKLVRTYSSKNKNSRRQMTQDDKQQLKSLGYISAFSDKGGKALDPKKGILLKNSYREIEAMIDTGDSDLLSQAENRLKNMAAQNPDTLLPQYFGLLDLIYKKRGEPAKLIANWENAIKTFPANEFFKVNLAYEYFHLKQMDKAEALAKEIVEKNSTVTQAHILLARVREYYRQPGAALPHYQNAIRTEPNNVSLRISYCKVLGQLRRFDQAWQECQTLLSDPTVTGNNVIKARLGIVLVEIRRDAKAMELLSAVVQADDSHADAWNYLGILYYRQKDFQKAGEAYEKAIKLDPRIAKAYNNLGTLYLTMAVRQKDAGLLDQAVKTFDKALELDPGLASALNGRASAHKFSKRPADALRDWKKALDAKPDFIDVYFNIAVTYLQVNDKNNALVYLNRCKEGYYQKLPPRAQERLDRLIAEARK